MTLHGPVALVRSSHAGRGQALDPAALLAAFGVRVAEDVEAHDLDGAPGIGRSWRDRGLGAVVAAGGDGTIGSATAAALASGLPLGILPAGTANDVARSLQLPLQLEAAAAALAGGRAREIDAGQVLAAEPGASVAEAEQQAAAHGDAGRGFLHIVALGAKVEFARLATDQRERQRWGRLTYPVALAQALVRCRPIPVTLRMAGGAADEPSREIACRALQVLIANTAVLGGALNVRLPDVDERDRLLNVIVVEAPTWRVRRRPRRGASAEAPRLVPRLRRYTARAVVLETPEPCETTLDGEVCMRTPLLVRIAERRLPVLMPIGSRHGSSCDAYGPVGRARVSDGAGEPSAREAAGAGDERAEAER